MRATKTGFALAATLALTGCARGSGGNMCLSAHDEILYNVSKAMEIVAIHYPAQTFVFRAFLSLDNSGWVQNAAGVIIVNVALRAAFYMPEAKEQFLENTEALEDIKNESLLACASTRLVIFFGRDGIREKMADGIERYFNLK